MHSAIGSSRLSLGEGDLDDEFDRLLETAGGTGWQKWRTFLLLQPVFVFLCFVYFGHVWLLIEPQHWCRQPELDKLGFDPHQTRRFSVPRVEDSDEYDGCRAYDVNYTLLVGSGNLSRLGVGHPTTKCRHGWHYDYGVLYPTAVSEFGWVCDRAWLKPLMSSLFFVGAVIGTMLFGWAADRCGRLPALVTSNLLGCVAGLLTASSTGAVTFALSRLLAGATYDQQCMLALVMLSEAMAVRHRSLVINLPMATSFMLAGVTLPWLASYLAHWRTLALVTSAPMGITVFYLCLVPESARWLARAGRVKEAVLQLRRMAHGAGWEIPEEAFAAFEERVKRRVEAEKRRGEDSVAELFRRPVLRGRTLLLMFTTMAMMLSFDSSMRNTSFDIDVRVAASALSLMELPADLVVLFLTETVGRRPTFCGALLMTALASLMLGLTLHTRTLPAASTTFALLGRLSSTVAANVCWQLSIELIPTQVRSRGCGLIHMAGHAISFVSPYILHLHRQMRGLPQILYAVLAAVGGAAALLLPETAGRRLPDTLEQAELFGVDEMPPELEEVNGRQDHRLSPVVVYSPPSPARHQSRDTLAVPSAPVSIHVSLTAVSLRQCQDLNATPSTLRRHLHHIHAHPSSTSAPLASEESLHTRAGSQTSIQSGGRRPRSRLLSVLGLLHNQMRFADESSDSPSGGESGAEGTPRERHGTPAVDSSRPRRLGPRLLLPGRRNPST